MRNDQDGLCGLNKKIYKVWHGMLTRCNDHSHSGFHRYGGRGIEVCSEWVSFKSFVNWAILSGYDQSYSLDRIDNNGNYEPSNCRWADRKTQSRNRENNVFYEYGGERKTIPEWAEIYDLKVITLACRLNRMGWSIERALLERPSKKDGLYSANGETKHLKDWAKIIGIKPEALYLRMRRGKTLEDIVNKMRKP